MKPTDVLKNEHRVIERVLTCLGEIAGRADSAGRLEDAESARDAVAFFRDFADRCHHAKEESRLFPAMEARGYPREGGPTGVMMYEHQQAREHVRRMGESIEAASSGDPAGLQEFLRHAREYDRLLREHITKEDHCLFTMADQAFGQQDQEELLRAFEKAEAEDVEPGLREKCLRIVEELEDRYPPPGAAAPSADDGGRSCASDPPQGGARGKNLSGGSSG